MAEHQSAGRGRQGRAWSAPRGRALTLSALVRPRIELLPLAVALAVCEACEAVAPVSCAIKWPNDIWIEERKVAGILIEARPREGWAVLGIGLNVDTAEDELVPELRETATSLRIATGEPVDRDAALAALFDRLAEWTDAVARPYVVTDAFRERDALYGREIAWTHDSRRMSGAARGIDDDGSLVVFTPGSEEVRLDAGEVHLEPPPRRGPERHAPGR
jgi:BirA family biotin operon repressor/biotin-[acetyl-CoA-carboxylase] ligase